MVVCGSYFGVDDGMDIFVKLDSFEYEFKAKVDLAAIDRSSTRFEDLLPNGHLQLLASLLFIPSQLTAGAVDQTMGMRVRKSVGSNVVGRIATADFFFLSFSLPCGRFSLSSSGSFSTAFTKV